MERRNAVAYRLLKDLPNVKAGAILTYDERFQCFSIESPYDPFGFDEQEMINLKDWFEPIYEKTQEEMVLDLRAIMQFNHKSDWMRLITNNYTITKKNDRNSR